MHLVIMTTELAMAGSIPGGLGTFSANLARIFKRNGHKITILLVTTKENNICFDDGIEVQNIYVEKAMWDKFANIAETVAALTDDNEVAVRRALVNLYKGELIREIINEINQREKIDIIHACNLGQFVLGLDGSIPYVVRISSFLRMYTNACLPETRKEYYEAAVTLQDKLETYLLQKSRYIISPSNLLAEIGKEKMGINPVVIESPFILDRDNWDYSIYHNLVQEKRYIIHFGQMSYFKGTHIVAKIVKSILECHPDIYLLLVGKSEEMQDDYGRVLLAHELVRESAGSYADRVIYAGILVREQLYPLIDNAELCLLPSRTENFANACVEAMAMGKIVIGTEGASFEQLIDDRKSGFLCEHDMPMSYLKAVEEALSMNADEKRQMGLEASKQVKRLAPDVIYWKYYDFYQKVIDEW